MEEESSSATAPTPQKPSLARASSRTNFHLAMIRARNDIKRVPFRLVIRLSYQEPLYGPGIAHGHRWNERIDRKDSKRSRWACVRSGRLPRTECPPAKRQSM